MRIHLITLIAAGLLGGPVIAPARAAAAAPAGCDAVTPAAVADYFDQAVPAQLTDHHVPGVVVSVVDEDSRIFDRGYGLASVGNAVAMDPARSLVRIASITKLFTWTAVMQQVQAGRLDLNADVNRYLTAFKVPATYPQPITLQNLMDHTAGFEDIVIGTGAETADGVPPLEQYLSANMPARIRPPGVVEAYSNYGAALAGYVVAQVSGEPWDQYVQHHILDPLQMGHTTATEPVPATLAPDLAHSYDTDVAPVQTVPFTFDRMPPDGAISTTADDMAQFMLAHLNPEANPLLTPATMELMHSRSFAIDPRLGGIAHGFMDRTINGHRVLMHDGSWEAFGSVMVLVPECGLGLFLSTNSYSGFDAVPPLMYGFFDRFLPPGQPGTEAVPATAPAGSAPTPGFYRATRHNESTVEKLKALTMSVRLTAPGDGTLHFGGKQWVPAGGGLYRSTDGRDHLTMATGTDGRSYLATDGPSYQREAWYETPTVNLIGVLVYLALALLALAVPVAAGWRRLRRRTASANGQWRLARGLAAGGALLGVAFLVGLFGVLLGDTTAFLYAVPLSFRLLMLLPLLVLVAGAAAAVLTIRAWRGSRAGFVARTHQVVTLAALVALAAFLWQWNLIGWQF